MDAATGTAATFPSGRADAGHFSSAGAWLTPAWLGESFSNIAVLRMRWDDLDGDTTSTSFDAGVRSVYAFERYAASVEVVNRLTSRAGESKDLVRFGVTFDAKVGSDVWLNVSLGKEFDASKPQSLRALLGFQWQLGDRAVQPDR
jgi:hypothetical protein